MDRAKLLQIGQMVQTLKEEVEKLLRDPELFKSDELANATFDLQVACHNAASIFPNIALRGIPRAA